MKDVKPWLLLVEDDHWLAELYGEVLEAATNMKVRRAQTAEAALEILGEENKPILMLIDLFLPGFSGLEMLHELASYQDTADIPSIIISSVPERDLAISRQRLKHYGVIDYLYKPTSKPQDIASAVVKHLSVVEAAV